MPENEAGRRPTWGRDAVVMPVVAALVATLIAWFAAGRALRAFDAAHEAQASNPSPQIMHRPAVDTTGPWKTATVYGSSGLMLGLALGLAGGYAVRSIAAAVRGGLVGLLTGAVVGTGVGYALGMLFARLYDSSMPANLPLVVAVRGGAAAALGVVGGLAFGIARGGGRSIAAAVLGGLAGAVLGAVAGELLNAIIFISAASNQAFPTTEGTRLISLGLVAVLSTLGVVWSLRNQRISARPSL